MVEDREVQTKRRTFKSNKNTCGKNNVVIIIYIFYVSYRTQNKIYVEYLAINQHHKSKANFPSRTPKITNHQNV